MHLTKTFLSQCFDNGYIIEKQKGDKIILIPDEIEQFYMPNLVITSLIELEELLKEYVNIIRKSTLKFYKLDENHQIKNYLFYLIKSLTNDDCQDLNKYIKRFINYLKDEKFNELYYAKIIGTIEPYNVLARKCEEYYGSETPFTFRLYLEKIGFKFEMPLVRYGISNNTAYIYSIQRKRKYSNSHPTIKSVNSLFNTINIGIKENRDITPSMLCSLAVFVGMLKSEEINEIKVDGFLTRRYGYLNGIETEEEKDKVLHNSIDKFFKLFLRLSTQFEGININAYPFDVDSYLQITLDDEISSQNELLNNLYNIGKNYHEQISEEMQLLKKQ